MQLSPNAFCPYLRPQLSCNSLEHLKMLAPGVGTVFIFLSVIIQFTVGHWVENNILGPSCGGNIVEYSNLPEYDQIVKDCDGEIGHCRPLCIMSKLGMMNTDGYFIPDVSKSVLQSILPPLKNRFRATELTGAYESCSLNFNFNENLNIKDGCASYSPLLNCFRKSTMMICEGVKASEIANNAAISSAAEAWPKSFIKESDTNPTHNPNPSPPVIPDQVNPETIPAVEQSADSQQETTPSTTQINGQQQEPQQQQQQQKLPLNPQDANRLTSPHQGPRPVHGAPNPQDAMIPNRQVFPPNYGPHNQRPQQMQYPNYPRPYHPPGQYRANGQMPPTQGGFPPMSQSNGFPPQQLQPTQPHQYPRGRLQPPTGLQPQYQHGRQQAPTGLHPQNPRGPLQHPTEPQPLQYPRGSPPSPQFQYQPQKLQPPSFQYPSTPTGPQQLQYPRRPPHITQNSGKPFEPTIPQQTNIRGHSTPPQIPNYGLRNIQPQRPVPQNQIQSGPQNYVPSHKTPPNEGPIIQQQPNGFPAMQQQPPPQMHPYPTFSDVSKNSPQNSSRANPTAQLPYPPGSLSQRTGFNNNYNNMPGVGRQPSPVRRKF